MDHAPFFRTKPMKEGVCEGMTGAEKDMLLVERREHAAYITLNRPGRRDVLSLALQAAIAQAFSDASEDNDVLAIVLTGAGDRAFCAGADLKELDELAREKRRFPVPMTGFYGNVFEAVLETYSQP
jgi:enoyl-CoA hydratase